MVIRNFIITAVLLAILGCGSKNSDPYAEIYKLSPSGKYITIEVDSLTSSVIVGPSGYYQTSAGEEYLYYSDYRNNLRFINLSDSIKTLKTVHFAQEGPNSVGPFYYCYYVHNLDSIFIRRHMTDELYLVDWNGKVLNKFTGFLNTATFFRVFHNGPDLKAIAVGTPFGMWSEVNLSRIHFLYEYDFKSERTETLDYFYPSVYGETGQTALSLVGSVHHNNLTDQESLIIGFESSEYVAAYDYENSKMLTYKVPSRFVEHPMAVRPKELVRRGDELKKFAIQVSEYRNIVYDPFRKVYYRIVKLGEDPIIGKLTMQSRFPAHFSIMVLNKDFDVIGETKLPTNTYLSTGMFVKEDGLYLSANHPENENGSEDMLIFERIDLVKTVH